MYFLGQTLNIFTLGGLALAVGRPWTTPSWSWRTSTATWPFPARRGAAVLDAAREVAMPIFVSTITTIVVSPAHGLPRGPVAAALHPLTFTISFSPLRLLRFRTVTPLLCYHWLKGEHETAQREPGKRGALGALLLRVFAWAGGVLDRMDALYQRRLSWALEHRKTLIGGILVGLASALAVLPLVGTEFFPESDESQFLVQVRAPVGTRVEETERLIKKMEDIIRASTKPEEIKTIVATIGAERALRSVFPQHRSPHRDLAGLSQRPGQRARDHKHLRFDPAQAGWPVPGTTMVSSSAAS
jgi:multidrug efflux pump subunit AcrB